MTNDELRAFADRLDVLAHAVTEARWSEFSMRVPVEPDRDADCVLSSAARELRTYAALLERQAQWPSDEVTLREAANEALGLLELLDSQHGVTTQLRAALQAAEGAVMRTLDQVRDGLLRYDNDRKMYNRLAGNCLEFFLAGQYASVIDAHLAQQPDLAEIRKVIKTMKQKGYNTWADKLARSIGDAP